MTYLLIGKVRKGIFEILGTLDLIAGGIGVEWEARLRHRSSYSLAVIWDFRVLDHLKHGCFEIVFKEVWRIEIYLLNFRFFFLGDFGFMENGVCFKLLYSYLFGSLRNFLLLLLFELTFMLITLVFLAADEMFAKSILSAVLFVT